MNDTPTAPQPVPVRRQTLRRHHYGLPLGTTSARVCAVVNPTCGIAGDALAAVAPCVLLTMAIRGAFSRRLRVEPAPTRRRLRMRGGYESRVLERHRSEDPPVAHELHLSSRPAPEESFEDGSVTFIGTATVLIRCGGFTLLTDPNFLHQGDHAPLGWGLRSRRLTNPAIELDELPHIDAVVLSHHHGDHFDPIVVRRLDKDTPIITEPHSANKLRRQHFRRTYPLATWESMRIIRDQRWIEVTATPGKHAPAALQPLLPR